MRKHVSFTPLVDITRRVVRQRVSGKPLNDSSAQCKFDPGFALAHSELADCYSLLNWYVEPPPPEAWQRAKAVSLEGCRG